ncbi:MAG: Eco57I restriction-modification methylase domain-containing protein, partial [Bacteroidota bacterium]
MKAKTNTPKQALNKAFRKEKVSRTEINRLKRELPLLLERIANAAESEENHKGHFQDFLKEVWYKADDCLVAPKGRIDLVIHDGPKSKDPVGVMIEAKRRTNKVEMFSAAKPNVKSLHELVLYFLRERNGGNTAIKTLMITDADETYLLPDREFERLFWEKKTFRKKVLAADGDSGKTNNTAYEIIKDHIETLDDTLHGTTFTLSQLRKWAEDGDPETDDYLIPLFKILSPVHLLRRPFAGDSNKLDKGFYQELLHIIGLEEVGVDSKGKEKKNGGKKIIRRATGANRHPASLLENTLQIAGRDNRLDKAPDFRAYGSSPEERRFGAALELCTTWVNRVLFLKLLESQLMAYHQGDSIRFLTNQLVQDYDALNTLFIDVLNTQPEQRAKHVAGFAHVPYLNSSLFEISPLESVTLQVSFLKDQIELPLAPKSILRTRGRAQKKDVPATMRPLEYLFAFLDAYDFSSEGKARIQEDNKRLINASVLGLIFEKINGYRDGSFYTPGFITEYMCRETIRRAVVQKFKDDTTDFAGFDSDSFDDLHNYLGSKYKKEERLAANILVNSLTVCDPAVGSGHFLVSALNELIATKSALGILGADAGAKVVDIKAVVENDELIVTDRYDEPYEYQVRTDANGNIRADELKQTIQETIFHEKRTLIENCLFGVDLNPNSVKICRLRLWIELLKSAYYQPDSGELETLPNIDINIKQGNSLISRFALDDPLAGALAESGLTLADYRRAVTDYHRATGPAEKTRLLELIDNVKSNFRTHISRNDKKVKTLATARGKLTKLEGLLEMGDLFGSVDEKKVRKEMAPLQKKVAKLEAEVEVIRNNAIYEQAFEWRFEFPAVLDAAGTFVGFDVVVGNPPYIVVTNNRNYYKSNYESIFNQFDLYQVFAEKSKAITASQGQIAMIVPNSWLANSSTKSFRKFVLDNFSIVSIIELGGSVFEEAVVDAMIFEFVNEYNNHNSKYFELQK